jgi:DNA-binding NarL/FixJ family response regulator
MTHVAFAGRPDLMREAVARYLEESSELKMAIVARSEDDLLNQLKCADTLPDICIFGTAKEDFKGYETLQKIRKVYPHLKVLILTACMHPIALMLAAHYGANGYCTMYKQREELVVTIKTIQQGGIVYEEAVLKRLKQMFCNRKRVRGMSYLSPGEIRMMELVNNNLCLKQVAAEMHVSCHSAQTLMNRLYEKLCVTNKEGLLHELYEIGL